MAAAAYELLSMLMRYVFVVLCGLILFRAWRQMRKDARAHKKELKKLPDAGKIGEVVDLETGKRIPLPREGTMGSAASCDIRLRRRGVKRRHALFEFVEGKGLRIKPCFGRKVLMENVPIKGFAYALHGTRVTLSKANICIRLFAGLNVPHPAAFGHQQPQQQPWPEEEDVMPRPFENMMTQQYAFEQPVANQPFNMPENETMPPRYDGNGIPLPPPFIGNEAEENDEAMPYFSPVERHRRSDRR